VAVSFHWPAPLSISGYAGTALGDFLPALPLLTRRFDVIGHAHPNWQRRGDGAAAKLAKADIPFVRDFDDVCRQADVYVCDNSSTIYEFAATGRPVVVLNARQWSRKGPQLGLRFWAASHVGINVDRHEDLVPAVTRALEYRAEDIAAREDALEMVYTYRYGAAERAAAAIVDWLGSRQEVAA
jgi:UDP-N-acetylglucosamine:LPS N-acetylglucosamine transferase